MRCCICSKLRMVCGTPRMTPECRTGCTVMVAVGTMKLRRALTASGMPMECPPPSTSVALGLDTLAVLMLHTGELVMDMGTVLDGRRAVKEKLIDELGGLSDALAWLYKEIERE